MTDTTVWLAYVSYPVTTAVYLERGLRRRCRTVTIGPRLPEELLERWQLQNMKLPVIDQEIPTGFTPDMAQIVAATPAAELPDLYLWVESVGGHTPRNLHALTCPKACYLIDNHLNLSWHLEWAKQFDHVFIAQLEYLPQFRAINPNSHWLPLGCDPEIHAGEGCEKLHDIGFVGSVSLNPRRVELLKQLDTELSLHAERCFWDDMARLFSSSRIVFNNAVRNDLNMRVFEVMSTGSLLLTDPARNSGQDILFTDGEDLAVYRHDELLVDLARFYLDNGELRERIAARGKRLVHNAHTYGHRVDNLLDVAAGRKPSTFSAGELRERSTAGLSDPVSVWHGPTVHISRESRSFVIPVLDHSPASEYGITTLLKDLEEIPGDVIVIFNSEDLADELKRHPRITRYAVMKQNIGVARAWNIGIDIAATPTVFILNADLHLEREAVEVMEQALNGLELAACVGPQGSFFDFALTRDYCYFDKGSFDAPLRVDAVSGFLFAIKREQFADRLLKFENGYTPCYFEEWDLGLQIKQAGLRSYVVPTTAYDHHWSGSIRALREIGFYERSETAGEILRRNRLLFLTKWRDICRSDGCAGLLESGFRDYGKALVRKFLAEGNGTEADTVLRILGRSWPDDPEILACRGFTAFRLDRVHEAALIFREIRETAPGFDLDSYCDVLNMNAKRPS
jgi:GT2 family glycosyltransferase